MLYLEYKKHNIPAELHICTKGGHGFGMRPAGNPVNDWPARCGEWMKVDGLAGFEIATGPPVHTGSMHPRVWRNQNSGVKTQPLVEIPVVNIHDTGRKPAPQSVSARLHRA